jgi:hypothetical protein
MTIVIPSGRRRLINSDFCDLRSTPAIFSSTRRAYLHHRFIIGVSYLDAIMGATHLSIESQ